MLTRRELLQNSAKLSLLLFGSKAFASDIYDGFIKLEEKRIKVIFIQGLACSGCSVSMMYGNETGFIQFIKHIISLQVHPMLSFESSEEYLKKLKDTVENDKYLLVAEGSIPLDIPNACNIGDKPLKDFLKPVCENASVIVASGTCSSHGGIPAAVNNETGAVSLIEYLNLQNINKPYLRIPGCPVHPDWLMGSISYIAATGKIPELTKLKTPAIYFKDSIHNHCNRFQHFSQDLYLEDYTANKTNCLLKKGCRGPITYSDCPIRNWNNNTNFCIKSNAPCVGCVHPDWPFDSDMYITAENVEDITWWEMQEKVKNMDSGKK